MNNKENFMLRAVELSKKSIANSGGPFGCVIVKDNIIVAEGYNQVTKNYDPTAHAEIVTIRDACSKFQTFDLSGFELYTSCEPCPMCLSAIYWSHIDKVYYGNSRSDAAKINFDDDHIYKELNLNISDRKIKMIQINKKEAKEAFNIWEMTKDKINY